MFGPESDLRCWTTWWCGGGVIVVVGEYQVGWVNRCEFSLLSGDGVLLLLTQQSSLTRFVIIVNHFDFQKEQEVELEELEERFASPHSSDEKEMQGDTSSPSGGMVVLGLALLLL
jgi:hypothetical protein